DPYAAGVRRLEPGHLAAGPAVPGRAHHGGRGARRGVAVHLPGALSGVCALPGQSRGRRARLAGGGHRAHAADDGRAAAVAEPKRVRQPAVGSRSAIRPSWASVAAMTPSARIRLPVTTPRPLAAAGEVVSSWFHSPARTGW